MILLESVRVWGCRYLFAHTAGRKIIGINILEYNLAYEIKKLEMLKLSNSAIPLSGINA